MKHYTPQISWHGQEAILAASFQPHSKDYRIATCGLDRDIRIWKLEFNDDKDVMTACFLANIRGRNPRSVNVVRFSPNGKWLASGDVNGDVAIWYQDFATEIIPDLIADDDLPPNKEIWKAHNYLRGSLSDINDLCWSADSTMLAVLSCDKSMVIYSINDTGAEKLETIHQTRNRVDVFKQFPNGVAFDPCGRYLCVLANDRMMRIFGTRPLVKSKRADDRFPLLLTMGKTRLPLPNELLEEDNSATTSCISTQQSEIPSIEDKQKITSNIQRLFHDDQLMTFSRRCSFSPCGELLVTPAGILGVNKNNINITYIFTTASHFNKPALILKSKEPSLGACFSPIIYALDEVVKSDNPFELPYRCIVAVITAGALCIYDTQTPERPIVYAANVHYAMHTDIFWSSDGRVLGLASQDGYLSFFRFKVNELGVPISKENLPEVERPLGLQERIEAKLDKPKRRKMTPVKQKSPTAKALKSTPSKQAIKPNNITPITAFFGIRPSKRPIHNISTSSDVNQQPLNETDENSIDIIEEEVSIKSDAPSSKLSVNAKNNIPKRRRVSLIKLNNEQEAKPMSSAMTDAGQKAETTKKRLPLIACD